jgi:hypothetical protein
LYVFITITSTMWAPKLAQTMAALAIRKPKPRKMKMDEFKTTLKAAV